MKSYVTAALLGSICIGSLSAQEHYSRPPEFISSPGHDVTGFAIASDRELTVALYREEASGIVYATTNDGRALPGDGATPSGWTPAQAVSATSTVLRRVQRDSIHVVGNQAAALWLDDGFGAANSSVMISLWTGAGWTTPVATHPLLGDVEQFAAVATVGINGALNVHVIFSVAGSPGDTVFLASSIDGGSTFGGPALVSTSTSSGQVGGVAIDSQLAEVYAAWTSSAVGTVDTWFRRGLQGWFGAPFWLSAPANLSTNPPGSGAVDAPIVQVGGSVGWTGAQQRTVGVGWRRDDGDGTRSLRLAVSQDSGATFGAAAVVAHTDLPGVDVAQFDLELVAGEVAALWQDNATTTAGGSVIVPATQTQQVWRAETTDGTTFTVVQQLSAQTDPTARGSAVQIARLVGAADGTMAVFLEESAAGIEVKTAFADQANGTEWHDEYLQVSTAQGKGPARAVTQATVAYNALYYNFIVGWLQETAAGSDIFRLVVGGYRPPEVKIEGWYQGTSELHFAIDHVPFQDAFGFVLLSLGANNATGGNLLLPDGRKTGLILDEFTIFGAENLVLFLGPNDPNNEGVVTPIFPATIPGLPVGFELCAVGITWGPFGSYHVLTDWVCQPLGPPQ